MMPKQMLRLAIAIFLVILVAVPEAGAAKKKTAPAKKTAASAQKAAATSKEKAASPAPSAEPVPIKYTGMETKRDPFALPAAVVKSMERPKELKAGQKVEEGVVLPKMDIQGIVWNETMPQVIVNGTVMKVGDFVEQFEIKEITRKSIILFLKGREYEMIMQSKPVPGIRPGRKPKR